MHPMPSSCEPVPVSGSPGRSTEVSHAPLHRRSGTVKTVRQAEIVEGAEWGVARSELRAHRSHSQVFCKGAMEKPLPFRLPFDCCSSPHSYGPIRVAGPPGITASEPSVGRLRCPCFDLNIHRPVSSIPGRDWWHSEVTAVRFRALSHGLGRVWRKALINQLGPHLAPPYRHGSHWGPGGRKCWISVSVAYFNLPPPHSLQSHSKRSQMQS
ncbi:uncharacterized protein B0H64DRAFT_401417 [Chaetomium fimeti]|uniref:Uncharacterized protein n=1 Tax=Chaetomium fimeti TaxID=1854472 RepID=A0AAE0HDW3_9PEZI|nr:hypothetical protein B0H64DRAFT_401417 [Chaetomium fimeti]